MIDENQTPSDTGGAAAELSEIETNLMQFLDPTYAAPAPADEPSEPETPASDSAKEEPEKPPVNPAPPAPSNAPVVEPVAEEPKVDPALLSQFFTTENKPQGQPETPAAPAQSAAEAPKKGEPWTPFSAPIELPPQLAAALFESDDTNIRAQALGVVINSIGNGIAQLVEKRFMEHYAPMLTQSIQQSAAQQSAIQRVDEDFYGAYPELVAHKDAVRKAFAIVAKANPQATYSPEVRKQVGELTKQALTQMGVQFAAAAPVETKPKPATQTPKQPFIAGGSRPGNFSPQDGMTPASLVDELGGF